ncbi:dihydroneopterin aldolase [Defluviimonas sp. WL0024]|uniref:Dihydroneopterin aldolase n=1 Tax=Albidovulum salinarum TaxID=2984153 RepID=A0ABT2X5E9_9RHOB|nr:dihydroneopterin aldolase [Defluviimonas sp. WL0024]MCU9847045.1 dihydroneopterin aldolase [Defluviimonas sp. WL0024]
MTDEIHQAFAHPEARAAAMAPANPPDRLSLRDHIVAADIGAFQQERGQEQRLRFNVVVELARGGGDAGDDVDQILSYDRLTEAIAAELAAERLNLLETLAENIAARILAEPQPCRVFLRIEKLDRGPGALGVEIVRSRAEAAPVTAAEVPHPVVAYLDNATIAAPDLSARLDRLAATAAPVVLAVGLPDTTRPATGDGPCQTRIDLLAIEQNAWVLASRDPRLNVVATRTELDWAMKQGNMVVWAPSKLVLDTPGAPGSGEDGVALAAWLAGELAALRLVVHGPVSLPAACRVPVEPA